MKLTKEWFREHAVLLFIIAIGSLIRLLFIGTIPPGLNQDEASIGYDAYAILNYGVDRNGIHNPIHLIAWGSGQNALYAYFSMPFIYLFGLTPLTTRAVSILFGIIGLVAFYYLVKRMTQNNQFALLGVFLLAISPWHIMMSRWGLESNLFPSIVLISVLLLVISYERNKIFPLACAMFALSLYAYGTAYFFVPVFLLLTMIYSLIYKKLPFRQLIVGAIVFITLSLPIFLFVIINRLKQPSIDLGLFTIPRLSGPPRVEQVSSIFQSNAIGQLWSNFKDFIIMFTKQDDGFIWNALPPYGFLYMFCIPFLLIGFCHGIYKLKHKKWNVEVIMLIWFITAVVMACITDVNINRINIIYFPAIYLAAYGIWMVRKLYFKLFVPIVVVFSLCFFGFTYQYFTKFPEQISSSFFESFGDALEYAAKETEGNIAVTAEVNMPYIYALFYEKTDPNDFIETVQYSNPNSAFQQVSSFGRYYFGDHYYADPSISAFVIPNHKVSEYISEQFQVRSFKRYSVAIREGQRASAGAGLTATGSNLVHNGGFEQQAVGWTFIGGAGITSNHVYEGQYLAYLDIGEQNKITQTIQIQKSGIYQLTSYVSTNGDKATIGLSKQGDILTELTIPRNEEYIKLVQEVSLNEKDKIDLYIIGGEGWVNVDHFSLHLMQ